jgi:hypothetical protein
MNLFDDLERALRPPDIMRDVARTVSEDISRELQRSPQQALNIIHKMQGGKSDLPNGFPSPDDFFNFNGNDHCHEEKKTHGEHHRGGLSGAIHRIGEDLLSFL